MSKDYRLSRNEQETSSSSSASTHQSSETFVNFLPLENSPDVLPSLNHSFLSLSSYRSALLNQYMTMTTSTSTFSDLSFSSNPSEPESPPPMIPSFNSNNAFNQYRLNRNPSIKSPSTTNGSPSSYFYSPISDVSSIRTPQSHFNMNRTMLPRDVSFMDVFAPKTASPPNFKSQSYSSFSPPTPSTLGTISASPVSTLASPQRSTRTRSNPHSPASPQSQKSVRRGFKLPEFSMIAPTPELSPAPRFQTVNISVPSPESALSPAFVPAISRKKFLEPNIRTSSRSILGKRTFGMRRSSSAGLDETVREEDEREVQAQGSLPPRSNSEPCMAQNRREGPSGEAKQLEKTSVSTAPSSDDTVTLDSSTPSTPRRPSKSSLRPKSIRRVSTCSVDSSSSQPKAQLLGSPINLTQKSVGLHQLLNQRQVSGGEGLVATSNLEKNSKSGPSVLLLPNNVKSSTVSPAHPPRLSSLDSTQATEVSSKPTLPLKRSNSCFSDTSVSGSDLSPTSTTFEDSASLRIQAETRARTLRRLEEKAQDPSAFSPDTFSSPSVYSNHSDQSPYCDSTIASQATDSPSEEQQLQVQLQRYRIINQSLGSSSNRSSRSSLLPPPKPRPQVGLPPIPTSIKSSDSNRASLNSLSSSNQIRESRSESLTQLAVLAGAQLELVEAARALEKQRRNSQLRSPSLTGIKEVKDDVGEDDSLAEERNSSAGCNRPRSSTIDQITRRCFEPPSSPPVRAGLDSSKEEEEEGDVKASKRNSLLREILMEGSRSSWWRSDSDEEAQQFTRRESSSVLQTPTQKDSETGTISQDPLKTPSAKASSPQVRNLYSSPSLQSLMDYKLPSRQRPNYAFASSSQSISRSPHPFTFSPARSTLPVDEELDAEWENVEADPDQQAEEWKKLMSEDQRSIYASCGKSSGSNLFQLFKAGGKKRRYNEVLPSTASEKQQVKPQASFNIPRKPLLITAEVQVITRAAGRDGEEEMEVLKTSTPEDPKYKENQDLPEPRCSSSASSKSQTSFSTPTLGPLFFMEDSTQSSPSLYSQTEASSTHTIAATRTPQPDDQMANNKWTMQLETSPVVMKAMEVEVIEDQEVLDQNEASTISETTIKLRSTHKSQDQLRISPKKSPRSRNRSTQSHTSRKESEVEQFYPALEGPFKYQDMLQMSKTLLLKGEERREREQRELEIEEREKRLRKTSSGGQSKKSSYSLLSRSSKKTSMSTSSERRKGHGNKIQIGDGEIELELEGAKSKRDRSLSERRRKKSNLSDTQKTLYKKRRSRSGTTGATDYKFEKDSLPPLPSMPLSSKIGLSSKPLPEIQNTSLLSDFKSLTLSSPKPQEGQVPASRTSSCSTPPDLSLPFWSSRLDRDPIVSSPTISIVSSNMDTRSMMERKGKFSNNGRPFRLNLQRINSVRFPRSFPSSPPTIQDQFQSFNDSMGDSTGEDFVSARGSLESLDAFEIDQRERSSFALMALRALELGEAQEDGGNESSDQEVPRMISSRSVNSSPESAILCLTP